MDQKHKTFISDTLGGVEIFSDEQQLDLTTSIWFYVIQWLLILPTLYLNILVFRMAMRDAVALSLELKVYSFCNILSSIYILVFMGVIKFSFPASSTVGSWYCHISNIALSLDMWRVTVFSTSVAVHRYIFIMYRETVKASNKRENRVIWAILIAKWLILLVFTAKFIIFNDKDQFAKVWITVCNGEMIGSSLPDNSTLTPSEYIAQNSFFVLTEDKSALITLFGDIRTGAVAYFLMVLCIVVDVLILATTLNLGEGLMYYRIAKYMKT